MVVHSSFLPKFDFVELLTRNIGVKEFSISEDVPSVILYLNVVHLRQVLLNRQLYAWV